MTKRREIYKCLVCGNVVEVISGGDGVLVCCGEDMVLMEEKVTGEKQEWHIPVFEKTEEGKITVKVGQNPHPMTMEHHIEMIEICDGIADCKKYLSVDEKPQCTFEPEVTPKFARAYCNLHGLWKGENI